MNDAVVPVVPASTPGIDAGDVGGAWEAGEGQGTNAYECVRMRTSHRAFPPTQECIAVWKKASIMTTFVVVGVMLPPWARQSYQRQHAWKEGRFAETPEVSVKYLVGRHRSQGVAFAPAPYVRIEGREALPHVGKVTEKSAHWLLADGAESFRCKADDDTLVHYPRLLQTLKRLDPTKPVWVGYTKWRGGEAGGFRACGGVWGTAENVWTSIKNKRCADASGPYPYQAGAFYCLSKAALHILQGDREFRAFLAEAERRNTLGKPCRHAPECAEAPRSQRMWHHEDGGLGFNIFRAVVRANATMDVVNVPGHFNDPFAIELSESPADHYWSTRGVYVHGAKRPPLYKYAATRWHTSWPMVLPDLQCMPPGAEPHSRWSAARLPCDKTLAFDDEREGRMCRVDPSRHFRMCRWPWRVPDYTRMKSSGASA